MQTIPIAFDTGVEQAATIKYCYVCRPETKGRADVSHGICLPHANEIRARMELPLRMPPNWENTLEGQLAREAK